MPRLLPPQSLKHHIIPTTLLRHGSRDCERDPPANDDRKGREDYRLHHSSTLRHTTRQPWTWGQGHHFISIDGLAFDAGAPGAVPPLQCGKPVPKSSGSVFGFFWDAFAKVQHAHSNLDEYLAHWFGLNRSKYQWALNYYIENN